MRLAGGEHETVGQAYDVSEVEHGRDTLARHRSDALYEDVIGLPHQLFPYVPPRQIIRLRLAFRPCLDQRYPFASVQPRNPVVEEDRAALAWVDTGDDHLSLNPGRNSTPTVGQSAGRHTIPQNWQACVW